MAAKKTGFTSATHIPTEQVKKVWQEGYKQTNKVLSTESSLKGYVIAAFIVNAVVILAIFLGQSLLPPQVPLYYGLPEGEDQLATKFLLTLPSFLSILFLMVNVIIGYFLENKFLRKVLIITSLVITLFSTITTVRIFFLVGTI